MTSIALGTLEIQGPGEMGRGEYIERLEKCIEAGLRTVVTRIVDAQLEGEVTAVLGRERYQRRNRVPRKVTTAQCNRCGTRAGWRFRRNGHYARQLLTRWGHIRLQMPQLVCECGGSVRMAFQTVQCRQRIWDSVASEIRERYGWGESLRGIKASLDRWLGSSLGLRTINARIHAMAELAVQWQQTHQSECPPVVRLDGLWVAQMQNRGEQRADTLGRLRSVKYGVRRPLLVAQGVWPSSGRQEIVAWTLGEAESAADWEILLDQMWSRGLRPERGLTMLAADGGAGLKSARELVYWNVPVQRCVFHKLRNIWDALSLPEEYEHVAGRRYKRRLIREVAKVWQAKQVKTARERKATWCLNWETEQPEAVATLCRDFEQTLTFYQVQAAAAHQGQTWPANLLRTTSHLERLFRGLRRRLRQAIVLHSDTGLTALAYQYFTRWTAGQSADPLDCFDWPLTIERALAAAPLIS